MILPTFPLLLVGFVGWFISGRLDVHSGRVQVDVGTSFVRSEKTISFVHSVRAARMHVGLIAGVVGKWDVAAASFARTKTGDEARMEIEVGGGSVERLMLLFLVDTDAFIRSSRRWPPWERVVVEVRSLSVVITECTNVCVERTRESRVGQSTM